MLGGHFLGSELLRTPFGRSSRKIGRLADALFLALHLRCGGYEGLGKRWSTPSPRPPPGHLGGVCWVWSQKLGAVARVGINQRVSLRKFIDDIRRWVDEGRSDDWIASALGTSPSSVQSFRSRNAIYRRGATSTLHDPKDFSSYEGVLEPSGPGVWFDPEIGSDPRWQKRWRSTERVELRLTPTRIVLLRRGKARSSRISS
jgi:hypothetical protein